MARIIHTADWHLGRLLAGARLTDDQAFALEGLVALVDEVRPDAIVVAGDVYDRAVPPPEAVTLLDETLTRLSERCGAVIVIAGNHDSPERMAFGGRLLARAGVHVHGQACADPASLVVHAADGPVRVWALPYADPAVVRQVTGDETLRGHDAAAAAMLDRIRAAGAPGERSIVVAHEFVAGGLETGDSERPLSVGGAAQVAPSRFAGFDYVALGHLHRPQSMDEGRIRYAGSLLKYSVAEAEHAKSVSVVELGDGAPRIEEVALPVRRDVRSVSGPLRTLVERAARSDDYVFAVLEDTGPLFDPMATLREVWPNCIGFVRAAESAGGDAGMPGVERVRALDTTELFAEFFARVTGDAPTDDERSVFADAVDALERAERGA